MLALRNKRHIDIIIIAMMRENIEYFHRIKRMHESGLIKKWTDEKMPMKDKCWEGQKLNQEATNHKVDMGDMQGIFFVLAIGKSCYILMRKSLLINPPAFALSRTSTI